MFSVASTAVTTGSQGADRAHAAFLQTESQLSLRRTLAEPPCCRLDVLSLGCSLDLSTSRIAGLLKLDPNDVPCSGAPVQLRMASGQF